MAARPLDSPGVCNVILTAGDAAVDLAFAGGLISGIERAGTVNGPDGHRRAAIPGLIDAHVHLDKAFQLSALQAAGLPVGTLAEALASTGQMRERGFDRAAAERLLERMSRRGTVAARVHVEVDARWGIEPVGEHVRMARDWSDRIELQLVAFPQNGLSAETLALMDEALGAGCHVVGGCPYVDVDPVAHVDAVFALAARHDRPVDFHVDFSDNPDDAVVDVVSSRSRQYGWAGRVTVGHVTSLAAADPEVAASRMRNLSAAGVGVISLPATDLYLGGRTASYARPRGLAPLRELLDTGIVTALGTNNVQNAFTPYGNGGLLPMAWLAGLAGHFPPGGGHQELLRMVTSGPAKLLAMAGGDIRVGGPADVVIVDADDPLEAVSGPADVVAVYRAGRLVAGAL